MTLKELNELSKKLECEIATIINLVKASGWIDDWQAKQLFYEANSGYLLTYSFLFDLGLYK
jgi:hypothetical protein